MHEFQSQLYFPPFSPAILFAIRHSGNEWHAMPLNMQNDSVEAHWLHLSFGKYPFYLLIFLKKNVYLAIFSSRQLTLINITIQAILKNHAIDIQIAHKSNSSAKKISRSPDKTLRLDLMAARRGSARVAQNALL